MRKYCVPTNRFGKKPSFFEKSASRTATNTLCLSQTVLKYTFKEEPPSRNHSLQYEVGSTDPQLLPEEKNRCVPIEDNNNGEFR
ncbi:MAG: hypothetical protein HC942_17180 [Microcoleus sp. SU_5_6]|nr:hypothetical protein [Microcoleus sp. SU_5_6]